MPRSAAEPKMRVLAVDDDAASLELLREALQREEVEVLTTNDPREALAILERERPQIAFIDLVMPEMTGMEVLERALAIEPTIEAMLMTGHYSTESAVEAIQKGAADYLKKPFEIEKLRAHIDRVLAMFSVREKARALDREMLDTFQLEGIIGRSPRMIDLFARIRRIAPHFNTALVHGPTGTGKESVAHVLHRLSPVAGKRFVVCNCSAVPETLWESEFFGHVRGAFTGAQQDKVGLFEYADGGTLFLDEVGEIPLSLQAKLLRALQNREIQRVGSPQTRAIDVRVIAATNRDLRDMVANKQFREDLYYRLAVVELQLPALAERLEDLPLLQRHFVDIFSKQYKREFKGITRRAQTLLARHSWPGNVRELENVLGNACMLAEGDVIDVVDLPASIRESRHEGPPALVSMEEMQRRHAARILEHVEGNKARAAEILGISRGTLYALLGKQKVETD